MPDITETIRLAQRGAQVRYHIRTWDAEIEEFTPQDGMSEIVSGFCGLRDAIRALRLRGYSAHRAGDDSDASVLIERIEELP